MKHQQNSEDETTVVYEKREQNDAEKGSERQLEPLKINKTDNHKNGHPQVDKNVVRSTQSKPVNKEDEIRRMNTCFGCTLIRPWPPINYSYLTWLTIGPNRPSFPLVLRKGGADSSSRIFAGVLQHGLGVVSADNVSLDTPVVDDTKEEDKEGVHRVLNGVEDPKFKAKSASPSAKEKKKAEELDGSDRFKLRNGREVCVNFTVLFFVLGGDWGVGVCWLAGNNSEQRAKKVR